MDGSAIVTLVFLVIGVLLMVSELMLPGLIVVFLGAAAVLVAGLRYIGLFDGLGISLVVWLTTSIGLVLALRSVARKYFPSEVSKDERDPRLAALGTVVDVIQDCDDQGMNGRIRYQGTTWPAMVTDGSIAAGGKAKLVYEDKEAMGWVIERLAELEAGDEVAGARAATDR